MIKLHTFLEEKNSYTFCEQEETVFLDQKIRFPAKVSGLILTTTVLILMQAT